MDACRWQIGQPASMILINDGSTVRLKEEGVAEWKTMDPKDRRVGMWLSFLGGQELSSDALARTFQASVASDTPARVAFGVKAAFPGHAQASAPAGTAH